MARTSNILFGCAGLVIGVLAGYAIWEAGLLDGHGFADRSVDHRQQISVAPTDFAFLPCPRAGNRGACLVIAAGGKRVLVGAPAGIGNPPAWGEGALGASGIPDAILLLSLDAAQIEGIDELRSRIWEADMSHLPLIGSVGVEEVNAGLDQTYIVPDAVAYVRRKRRRAFEKTPLAARMVGSGDIAFDTGDLTITALATAAGQLAYLVAYGGQTIIVSDCSPNAQDVTRWPKADYYLGCAEVAANYDGLARGDWPLGEPVFILGPSEGISE